MTGKDFFKSTLQSFFIVVTLINFALFILGNIFQPDFRFGNSAFLYPVFYGACSMIPAAIMYSKKEMTVRQLLFRKLIQMVSIIILLILCIFGSQGLRFSNLRTIIGVSFSIIIIYVLEEMISWFVNNRAAAKLTDELLNYQNTHRQEM